MFLGKTVPSLASLKGRKKANDVVESQKIYLGTDFANFADNLYFLGYNTKI